jgi:hypothetical protein
MSFRHFVRRTHLYLGLFLLPWVIMFGVSSIPLNHGDESERATWAPIADRPFAVAPPDSSDPAALHALGREMMNAGGVTGGFWVYRAGPQRVDLGHPNFLHPIRATYFIDQRRLLVERRGVAFEDVLTGMHTRGGYDLGGFWDSVWAVAVDVVSIALLAWIASGLFMWWKLPGTGLRRWGWLALAAGGVSFALIIARL